MRHDLYLFAMFFLSGSCCFAQAPTPAAQAPAVVSNDPPMLLADATPVMLRTKDSLSSGNAKVGDRIPFRVVEDVRVGDLLVIRRGADAWGEVIAVQPKRRKGRAGSVDVAIKSVQLLTGDSAPLTAEQHTKGAGKSGEMGLDMAKLAAETRLVGLPFVPLMMLEKGKDAYVPVGTKLTAYVKGDVAIERTRFEPVQPSPTPRSGPATITILRALYPTATGYAPSVYCGKIALARLSYEKYFKIQLPPGKYSFRSNDDQVIELTLKPGEEVYLQLQIKIHGFSVKGHITQIANSEGEDELAGLKALSDKEVTKPSDANLSELQEAPKLK